ncbi:TOBE domain-containing protein [Variovorax sp. PAMC 28711]|uniref:TOBE domain-containing protein n=1 Tax=Variovorax sp. PAMC 28711 TaxID=1795631 RepID=UPI00078E7878|nr:TOBE domain-containing protein [Variovorax sp. PAMC 28711]AMM25648.1 hypothetical protein AX767_15745 [Variovorax sp. PAMC 28711]
MATSLGQTSTQIDIAGAVQRPLQLNAAALAALPAADILSVVQTRGAAGSETKSTVRGVRLTALVEQAGLVLRDHNDWKKRVVIDTASDGYRALFSWPELKNTPVGDGALVLFERDGQPLDEREGRIALVSTIDRQPGPRRVRNLVRVEVRSNRLINSSSKENTHENQRPQHAPRHRRLDRGRPVTTEVTLKIAPKVQIVASITTTSADALKLLEGGPAYGLIKASSVMIGTD